MTGRWRFRNFQTPVLLALVTTTAAAETGSVTTMPVLPAPARHGVTIQVDTRWIDGDGYRPVRVQATALAASNADRTISFRFHAGGWRRSDHTMAASCDIDLPAGATTAATTLAVPEFEPWETMGWDVWVDGSFADELSTPTTTGPTQGGWSSSSPRTLVIGDQATLATAMNDVINALGLDSDFGQQGRNAPAGWTTVGRTPAELPTRWIDYSSLDIVAISAPRLAAIAANQPDAWRAIRRWVSLGGNLIVDDVGPDWRRLESIEKSLEIEANRYDESSDPLKREWRPITEFGDQGRTPSPNFSLAEMDLYFKNVTWLWKNFPRRATIQWRDYGHGSVIVMAPTFISPAYDHRLLQPLMRSEVNRFLWHFRHGVVPAEPTGEFWNFLIPGVGLAPVNAFRVLITLFVVVIGPLNYILLRRWRRLHLLVITVPACAAIVTLALFGYALIADGLGTQVRVRSVTDLDQRRGEAASWSRQSYYAGLAPRDGMTMPTDTVVIPILPGDDQYYYYGDYQMDPREIEWNDDQDLVEGWLPARSPTQMLVLRAHTTDAALNIDTDQATPRVTNRLGAPVKQLVVADRDGSLFWGESIAEGASAELIPISQADATGRIRSIVTLNAPQLPVEMDGGRNRRFGGSRLMYDVGPTEQEAVTLNRNRMERRLAALIPPGAAGIDLAPQSYIAILDRNPEIPIGVATAKEESSFHVILGKW